MLVLKGCAGVTGPTRHPEQMLLGAQLGAYKPARRPSKKISRKNFQMGCSVRIPPQPPIPRNPAWMCDGRILEQVLTAPRLNSEDPFDVTRRDIIAPGPWLP